jgi:phage gp46-like protein
MSNGNTINPCAPPQPRCRIEVPQPFKPGISTRHIPRCTENSHCGLMACDGGNWRVTGHGTLDRSKWIEGWAISQLFTRGRVTCEEHPLKKADGGWWLDAFRRQPFRSGSKLWSLNWAPVNNETLLTAKHYAYTALQYLLVWGVAASITIDARYVSKSVLHLHITITGPGVAASFTVAGTAIPDTRDWLWTQEKPK